MKITSERLRQIIMEEVAMSECGAEMEIDNGSMDGMDAYEDQPGDVEGLVSTAMAAIHDLAAAAGVDMPTIAAVHDDEMAGTIEVEFEEDE
jgi:hypothetical protein